MVNQVGSPIPIPSFPPAWVKADKEAQEAKAAEEARRPRITKPRGISFAPKHQRSFSKEQLENKIKETRRALRQVKDKIREEEGILRTNAEKEFGLMEMRTYDKRRKAFFIELSGLERRLGKNEADVSRREGSVNSDVAWEGFSKAIKKGQSLEKEVESLRANGLSRCFTSKKLEGLEAQKRELAESLSKLEGNLAPKPEYVPKNRHSGLAFMGSSACSEGSGTSDEESDGDEDEHSDTQSDGFRGRHQGPTKPIKIQRGRDWRQAN